MKIKRNASADGLKKEEVGSWVNPEFLSLMSFQTEKITKGRLKKKGRSIF